MQQWPAFMLPTQRVGTHQTTMIQTKQSLFGGHLHIICHICGIYSYKSFLWMCLLCICLKFDHAQICGLISIDSPEIYLSFRLTRQMNIEAKTWYVGITSHPVLHRMVGFQLCWYKHGCVQNSKVYSPNQKNSPSKLKTRMQWHLYISAINLVHHFWLKTYTVTCLTRAVPGDSAV